MLRTALGSEGVATDPATLALAGADIFPPESAVTPGLVIRPRDTDQMAAAMRLLARAQSPVVPRGAGLSYTAGAVPEAAAVAVDTRRMDAIHVVPDDLYSVVGAGCTWEALAAALRPHGLQAVPDAPISGSHSTVGGAMSQGIARSAGFIGACVVLADGSVLRTGAWGMAGRTPFVRDHGPDLTGLFVGDCGAFGVKTEVVVRLRPVGERRFASFGFLSAQQVVSAMAVMQRRVGGKSIAFDRTRARDAAASVDAGTALSTAAAVARRAGSAVDAIRGVLALGRTASTLGAWEWTLHAIADGENAALAEARLAMMREICVVAGGQEVAASAMKAMDAKPFSIRGMVGPDGERWVPVHGMLPLSGARACVDAVELMLRGHAHSMARHRVRIAWLLQAQDAAVTIEPMFYWRDALDPLHLLHMSARNRARFGAVPLDRLTRAFVRVLREEVRDTLDAHGAVHHQLGRFYGPPTHAALGAIKAALDPARRMNPGVLGL